MMATMVEVNADANTDAPWQLQQQQLLWDNSGKRWGGSLSKDGCGGSIGCVGGKSRPGFNGGNNRGGAIPAAGKYGGGPGGAALSPFTPRDRLLRGGGLGRSQSMAIAGECPLNDPAQCGRQCSPPPPPTLSPLIFSL